MSEYLKINSVSSGYENRVKQDLKFKTGKFVWRVFFNIPLNPATVNTSNLTVYNASNNPLSTRISYNEESNAIEIEPAQPYAQGEVYTLHVRRTVESKGGQRLKKDIDIQFTVQ